jgi:hypothetical protein
VVERLVAYGGRELLMLTDAHGSSCLYTASASSWMYVVETLLHVGGSELLSKNTHDGMTCLNISVANNHYSVTRVIADFKAKLLAELYSGR